MSAIPAASVSLKTMADGTLRMTFDIEPTQAKDAFSLFAAPGTPVAIAALQVGYAAKSPEPEQKEPLGPLAKWLVLRCKEPEFWSWMQSEVAGGDLVNSEPEARGVMLSLLEVNSRRDIDYSQRSSFLFHKMVREPYQKWLVRRSG